MGYTVFRPEELEFATPSAGNGRGIARLSDRLRHTRANVWRYGPRLARAAASRTRPGGDLRGARRYGDASARRSPERVEVPRGTVAIVEPGTPVQLRNDTDADAVVLILGAPPEQGRAEYLPDTG